MLLTITTTHRPATDLGFLLHKSPNRVHTFDMPFGSVHVFYPEASEDQCTAALLLEVDPVGLVRDRKGPAGEQRALEAAGPEHQHARPYQPESSVGRRVRGRGHRLRHLRRHRRVVVRPRARVVHDLGELDGGLFARPGKSVLPRRSAERFG